MLFRTGRIAIAILELSTKSRLKAHWATQAMSWPRGLTEFAHWLRRPTQHSQIGGFATSVRRLETELPTNLAAGASPRFVLGGRMNRICPMLGKRERARGSNVVDGEETSYGYRGSEPYALA
jgi:hypothetical protein